MQIFEFFMLIEAIQLVILSFKFSMNSTGENWTWILLIMYVIAILLLIVSAVLALLILALLVVLFIVDGQGPIRLLIGFAILICMYIIAYSIAFYLVISGMDILFTAGHVVSKNPKGAADNRLMIAGWIFMITNIIAFIIIWVSYEILKHVLLEAFFKDRSKTISLKTFDEIKNLNIKQVSDNYYQPMTAKEINEKKGENQEKVIAPTECTICYSNPPSTLFMPCGHGGLCEDCIRTYLQDKEECIYCKVHLTEVYLLVEDKENKTFKAKGVIKLKK